MSPTRDERLRRIREVLDRGLRYYATAYDRTPLETTHTMAERDLLRAYITHYATVFALLEGEDLDDRSIMEGRHRIAERYERLVRSEPWTPPEGTSTETAAPEAASASIDRPGIDRPEPIAHDDVAYGWRGAFDNHELNALHAEAFQTRMYSAEEWDWRRQVGRHSLGWVVARMDGRLIGFVNVPWDGVVHAWLQDMMVAVSARHRGVGTHLFAIARDAARDAGCEWLHVDFDDDLKPFYFEACGFTPTNAGVIAL